MNKDTLIIVGNGFDIWQGINTSYADFEKYYISHCDEIMRKLRIKLIVVTYEDGHTRNVSDVEMMYSDPFDPGIPDHDFWNRYESSLSQIDDQQINLFFGKERKGLKRIRHLAENANKILQKAFSGWIGSLNIDCW